MHAITFKWNEEIAKISEDAEKVLGLSPKKILDAEQSFEQLTDRAISLKSFLLGMGGDPIASGYLRALNLTFSSIVDRFTWLFHSIPEHARDRYFGCSRENSALENVASQIQSVASMGAFVSGGPAAPEATTIDAGDVKDSLGKNILAISDRGFMELAGGLRTLLSQSPDVIPCDSIVDFELSSAALYRGQENSDRTSVLGFYGHLGCHLRATQLSYKEAEKIIGLPARLKRMRRLVDAINARRDAMMVFLQAGGTCLELYDRTAVERQVSLCGRTSSPILHEDIVQRLGAFLSLERFPTYFPLFTPLRLATHFPEFQVSDTNRLCIDWRAESDRQLGHQGNATFISSNAEITRIFGQLHGILRHLGSREDLKDERVSAFDSARKLLAGLVASKAGIPNHRFPDAPTEHAGATLSVEESPTMDRHSLFRSAMRFIHRF